MLKKELGTGVYAVVKEGIHLETGQKVAVKVVPKKKLDQDDFAVLQQEVEILSSLNHPNIVK